jgi:hypothetical protein
MILHKHIREYGNDKTEDANDDQCNGKGIVDCH